MKDKEIIITLDKTAIDYFVDNGYDPSMGARPLKRLFEQELKKPLSKRILFEDLKDVELTISKGEDGVDINIT